jgi:hypothetical protein
MLSWTVLIEKNAKACSMDNPRLVAISMEARLALSNAQCPKDKEEKQEMANTLYSAILGATLYISHGLQPDIAYAASCVSTFAACPSHAHWNALKHVVSYLYHTHNIGLVLSSRCPTITLFTMTNSSFVDYM